MTSSSAKEFFEQGMEYFENGNWDLAIANFTSSINNGGGTPDAYNRRGEAYLCKGQYKTAIENYDQAIAIDANRAVFWLNRGWAYHNWAMYAPPTTPAKDWEGRYKTTGQNEFVYIPDSEGIARLNNRAISDLNNALTIDPMNHTIWHSRGWLYLNIGHYSQCIADCNRAIEIDPSLPGTWNNRGVAYRRLKKWNEATRDFDQAISIDPNYRLAINNRRDAIGGRRFGKIMRTLLIAGVVVAAIVIAAFTV